MKDLELEVEGEFKIMIKFTKVGVASDEMTVALRVAEATRAGEPSYVLKV